VNCGYSDTLRYDVWLFCCNPGLVVGCSLGGRSFVL
jgi:hypothetical protein